MTSLQEKFERFKLLTKEEKIISSLIKKNTQIKPETKVLEIGSNKGNISKAIQKNKKNITLVDVEEFDIDQDIKFIKDRWEESEIHDKYDLIIASHVWGHFHHTNTTPLAFNKALSSLNKNGKLFLCYNKNEGLMEKLISFGKETFENPQYDYFDESLLQKVKFSKKDFKINLKTKDFEDLADLIQVLIITPDKEFKSKKQNLIKWLKDNLNKPELDITQRIIVI